MSELNQSDYGLIKIASSHGQLFLNVSVVLEIPIQEVVFITFLHLSGIGVQNNMDSAASDLTEGLLKELECPVCLEYMLPTVIMCQNGHNICLKCRSKLHNCPTCKQRILNTRNLALENLAAKIKFPCPHRDNGCLQCCSSQDILEHKSLCPYGPVSCPVHMSHEVLCPWNGSRGDLRNHISSDHKTSALIYTGKDTVKILGLSPANVYLKLIFAYNEIFYRRTEVKNNIWHCTLLYIGGKKESSRFRYIIAFEKANNDMNIFFSQTACCLGEDIQDIYKQCKCVKLPYDVVKEFTDTSGNLVYSMEIFENKF